MVIARGVEWGHPGSKPKDIPVAPSDSELAALVSELRLLDPGSPPVVSVSGGDLLTTLGGRGVSSRESRVDHWWYPLDLGWVQTERGDEIPFVAHATAHRFGWRGESAVVMNAAWYRHLYLGPRAHPNDGLLDVTVGALPLDQRIEARRRARSGSHLPHPMLHTERSPRWEHRFERSTRVFADDEYIGSTHRLRVRLQTDAFWVVI